MMEIIPTFTQNTFIMKMSKHKVFILAVSGILITALFSSCKQEKTYPTAIVSPEVKDTSIQHNQFDLSFFKKEGDAYILPWPLLMGVKFEEKYDKKMAMEVALPLFSDTIQALNGKTVQVEGFYIPVSETGDDNIVILSAFPFAQCFFCGKAGIESIIDILAPKKLPQMKLDSKIKFRGRLKLNRDNFDYLIYVLEEAELVK